MRSSSFTWFSFSPFNFVAHCWLTWFCIKPNHLDPNQVSVFFIAFCSLCQKQLTDTKVLVMNCNYKVASGCFDVLWLVDKFSTNFFFLFSSSSLLFTLFYLDKTAQSQFVFISICFQTFVCFSIHFNLMFVVLSLHSLLYAFIFIFSFLSLLFFFCWKLKKLSGPLYHVWLTTSN